MNSHKTIVADPGDVVNIMVNPECKNKDQKRTISTNSKSVQKTERKRSDSRKTERENWRDILGQNALSIRETQSHKNKLPKNNVNKEQKNKNIEDCSKQCCSGSVLVQDRAVQCPDTNRFDEFSSQILSPLKEKLKVKKDECDIATESKKLLPQKHIDFGKAPELIDTKLEARTQSKEYIRKTKTLYEKVAAENKELQREIEKKDVQLEEINKEKTDNIRKFMQELEEAKHIIENKDKTIKTLEQKLKDQKNILDEKIQLLQQSLINIKYLEAEKDYYAELLQYQDERIKKYQNTMKELQNNIVALGTSSDRSSQTSVIPTPERLSSTPNSSFSDCSDKSWPDVSDISTVKQTTQSKITQKDAAHVDVSLADEESSTIDSCQNEDKSPHYLFNSVS